MKWKYLKFKIIPITQSIIGAILLIREIEQFFRLPNIGEVWYDTFEFKENTYSWIFLYAILLFSGLSYFINKKAHWVLNIAFLITICGLFFGYFYLTLKGNEFGATIFFASIFLFFSGTVILILKRKETNNLWFITKKTKILAIILGLCFAVVFWSLVFFRYWR